MWGRGCHSSGHGLGEQFVVPHPVLTLSAEGEATETQLHAEAPKATEELIRKHVEVGRQA